MLQMRTTSFPLSLRFINHSMSWNTCETCYLLHRRWYTNELRNLDTLNALMAAPRFSQIFVCTSTSSSLWLWAIGKGERRFIEEGLQNSSVKWMNRRCVYLPAQVRATTLTFDIIGQIARYARSSDLFEYVCERV